MEIDFSKIEGPVYTGRDRGERLRASFHLDDIDSTNELVQVIIPPQTYSISSSFFLGLFGPSVVRLGNKEAFFKKYSFVTSDFLSKVIDAHALRALQDRNLFSS